MRSVTLSRSAHNAGPEEVHPLLRCRTLHKDALRIIGGVDRVQHPAAAGIGAVRQTG